MSPLTDPPGPDLTATLRALKLGKLTATLPERLTLARQHNMPHADFLQLILSDEVARREAGSIALRARNAGLDPAIRTETWDTAAAIRYDQRLWNELISLRFLDGPHGALILGPVGVGKTHLATALGHIAVRRRRTVAMARADKLFKRLTAARLDNTLDYEYRRLTTVDARPVAGEHSRQLAERRGPVPRHRLPEHLRLAQSRDTRRLADKTIPIDTSLHDTILTGSIHQPRASRQRGSPLHGHLR